jgi:hypothetical protein
MHSGPPPAPPVPLTELDAPPAPPVPLAELDAPPAPPVPLAELDELDELELEVLGAPPIPPEPPPPTDAEVEDAGPAPPPLLEVAPEEDVVRRLSSGAAMSEQPARKNDARKPSDRERDEAVRMMARGYQSRRLSCSAIAEPRVPPERRQPINQSAKR